MPLSPYDDILAFISVLSYESFYLSSKIPSRALFNIFSSFFRDSSCFMFGSFDSIRTGPLCSEYVNADYDPKIVAFAGALYHLGTYPKRLSLRE